MQLETNDITLAPQRWPALAPGADDWFARVLEATPTALILTGHDGLIQMVVDAVPPAELSPIPSGARLCTDCLQEYQFLLEAGPAS